MIKVGAERQIQFDTKLRYERQKNYNIYDYDTVDYTFGLGDRKVYKNLNFSIFVDDYCNADCKFCVAQLRYSHRKLLYQKEHIIDRDEYLNRLEDVLKIVRPLNPSVSITGGEPTISPILPEVLRLVDKYNFRKRTITTNGSGLMKVCDNATMLEHLIKNKWQHLNISRAHFDDEYNKKIMQYQNDKEYCDMSMMKDILGSIVDTNLKHRISCILLREGINSVDMIKRYIDSYAKIGANNFIFREIMDYDKNSVNIEKMNYCTDNKVKLNDIWEAMMYDKEFEPYLNILGYYYYVEIYHYHGMTVASESANLNHQYVEKENHSDIVYEMIFHNNGNLCGSWVEQEEILDEYTKGKKSRG